MGIILSFIASLFSPATEILKNVHTSDADRMKLENELESIKAAVTEKMIGLEMEKIKLQEVEAQSSNFLVSSWRPICSIAVVAIIIFASFGIAHPDAKFYDLAQWFLVGYAGGRSLEKALPGVVGTVVKAIKK